MDGIDKMMTIERLYYNWAPSADGVNYLSRLVFIAFVIPKFIIFVVLKPNASEFETCKKGIWIQIKKDDEFRGDGIGDCLDGGSKKKDCFYLLLSGIGTFDAAAEQDAQVGFQTDASSIQYLDIEFLKLFKGLESMSYIC